jgi:hypothetical protein
MKEWKGEQTKIKNEKTGKINTKYKNKLKNTTFFFQKPNSTISHKPTCEVESV